ncbi:MAG: hypothetical protein M5R40_11580 [Anaerolineae bacterium]|nr:hypothetical protein [Anaerolineae bacterium]
MLAVVWRLGGDAGVALFTALVATAGMGFVYAMCAGSVYVRAFSVALGAAAAAVFWSARPQMLSFLLSAVVLYLLYLHKRAGRDRLLLIPLVMLLWVNLHGGFAIGFILLLGAIAGEALGNLLRWGDAEHVVSWAGVRRLVLVTALSAAAVCVNPYGPQMLAYPFRTVGIGALQDFIQEWASPNFHARQMWPFAFLLLAVYAAAGLSRRRLDWTDLVLTAGTAFLALTAARNIAVFAVVATPVLTRHVDAILDERGWQVRPQAAARGAMRWVNLALLVLILLGAALKVTGELAPRAVKQAQEAALPVRAAAWLSAARPEGKMFNSYNWGGYLMFAVPDYPVYVDGRTDLYDDAFLRVFLNTWRGLPGWEETLKAYDIGFVVIESGGLMANAMRHDAGWAVAYEDEQAVVFVRAETNP